MLTLELKMLNLKAGRILIIANDKITKLSSSGYWERSFD